MPLEAEDNPVPPVEPVLVGEAAAEDAVDDVGGPELPPLEEEPDLALDEQQPAAVPEFLAEGPNEAEESQLPEVPAMEPAQDATDPPGDEADLPDEDIREPTSTELLRQSEPVDGDQEQPTVADARPADEVVADQVELAEPESGLPAAATSIDAVELGGGTTIIAGDGPEGHVARLYADGNHIGDAPVSGGRWVLRAGDILNASETLLRADMLEVGSGEVQGRAEVLFRFAEAAPVEPETYQSVPPVQFDPGEELLGQEVQPASDLSDAEEEYVPQDPEVVRVQPSIPDLPGDAAVEEPILTAEAEVPGEPAVPEQEAVLQGEIEPEPQEDSIGTPGVGDVAPEQDAGATEVDAPTEPARVDAPEAPEAPEPEVPALPAKPVESPGVTPAPTEQVEEPVIETETAPADPGIDPPLEQAPTEPVPAQPLPEVDEPPLPTEDGQPEPASDGGPGAATGDEEDSLTLGAEEPVDSLEPQTGPETEIPELVAVPIGDPEEGRFAAGKAVIEPGDTLWDIAQRVYGEGVRFRAIFSANQDQIRDPHWIYPGQVFDLPELAETE